MKKSILLTILSLFALFFTQCTVKPSERSHNNAIGLWFGTTSIEGMDNWILGIDLKHLNGKNSIWDFNSKINTVFNLYSGFHFGNSQGTSINASYHILTDDLVSKTNGNIGQLYIGPSIGFDYIGTGGKPYKLNPNLRGTVGALMLLPAYKNFPESDISFEGSINIIDQTRKNDIGRVLYHVYLF